ncbi:MAG: TonB-dependent receptor [Vicinamibacterales bacterium]
MTFAWTRTFVLALAIAFLLTPTLASGQVNLAEFRGTVTDESGAVLPGVTITATHKETGTTRTTVSSQTGTYLMPALPIGTYDIKVELAGFASVVREGHRLLVGESAVVGFTLKVAVLAETVTVTGQSPLIETKESDLGGRVQTAQIESLPLSGRNWLELVGLVPGARGNPGTIGAGSSGGDASRYQMDGLSVTGQGTGGETQSYSHETVAEFQVITNRFDAEYGRVTGAVINAVSKSGTNQLHGSGLYFIRNDIFDAKNFFTGRVAPFDEKQTGFTVGGPIVRNRAHFFGAYEYQKRNVTARPNTGFALFDIDIDAGIRRKLPSGRVDVQVSQNHRVFARTSIYYLNSKNNGVGGNTTITAGSNEDFDTYDTAIGETWVIGNRLVNEIRGGLFYFYKNLHESAATPRYSFPSATLGPASNVPQWWNERIFQISDSLSYFVPSWRGEHRFKAGFQYTLPYYRGELPRISYGQFNFDRNPPSFTDMSTWPAPTRYTSTLGDFSYDVNNPVYGLFVQDDWTVAPRFTLNLGIRYDVEPKVTNKDLPDPLDEGPRRIDADNIAPRVGLAFDVSGNGRTVIRGGVGRYYGNILLNIPMNEARDRNVRISAVVVNPSLTNPLGGRTLADYQAQNLPRARTLMDTDYQTPRQDQLSIGFAHQFADRYSVQADFVHTDGRNQQMSRNINLFENPTQHTPLDPSVNGRPYPALLDITRYETWGRSRYDGLQTAFSSRRGQSRYQFDATYTLSWAKGHTNANRFGAVNNPFNLEDEYSYLTTDQRHRASFNGAAFLPWQVTVSAIFFAGSPKPLNITSNLDPFRSGTGRWLDNRGTVLPKNGERMLKGDYKLDVGIIKAFRFRQVQVQGRVDVFNVLNTKNWGSYGTTFGTSTYLVAGSSTNLFYQPRQFQFGARMTF